ncbi:zinc finger domain-containing protein [Streptomyces griseus]|uniref:zinc finger domain-containing protein n=1 Tax=Streptomyces griseus TaxID=1911 RepID=UPI0036591458
MTAKRYGQTAPMPDSIRHFMRAGQHPARATPCPHCQAAAHRPCRIPSRGVPLTQVHQQRIDARAQLVACCPTCQVTPTVPCHADGRALEGGAVHPARHAEADRSAA